MVLRDASGARRGMVAVIRNVEERKRAERRSAYFSRLGALVSEHRDPRALMRSVLPLVAEHLGADAATYAEYAPGAATVRVLEEHRAAGRSVLGEHDVRLDLSADGRRVVPHTQSLVIADVATNPHTAAHADAFARQGIRAMVSVPLLAPDPSGVRSVVSVTSGQPRAWGGSELSLLVETAAVLQPALERSRAEEALRRSEARFRQVFENAPTGIAISDVNTGFQQCNPAFAALVGYSEAELRDQAYDKLVHPEDREANVAQARRLLAGELPYFELENRYVRKDGREVWVRKYISVLRDDAGKPTHFVALVTDMTQRRQAEAALLRARDELDARVRERTAELQLRADQLSRLASDLTLADQRARKQLAQVLHDHLQQLLASAKMRVEVLARGPADREAAFAHVLRCLEEAIASARSLSVELSPPLLHEFGLAAGLEWLAEWMHEKHGLAVALDLDPSANPVSEDVRTLVFESVRELLFNAVKHAGVKTAAVALAAEGPSRCRVTVSDEGRGYEPAQAAKPHDLSRVGLGLLNVRERLTLLGGSMQVESQPGAGTRITLVAPRGPRASAR
jgi:PAS domain S-box-containing protein